MRDDPKSVPVDWRLVAVAVGGLAAWAAGWLAPVTAAAAADEGVAGWRWWGDWLFAGEGELSVELSRSELWNSCIITPSDEPGDLVRFDWLVGV